MEWTLTEVKPLGNRTLQIKFASGQTGTIRLDSSWCTGVFSALLDDALLAQAQIRQGVLTWPNGLDLAPDTMYQAISQSPVRHYEITASTQ